MLHRTLLFLTALTVSFSVAAQSRKEYKRMVKLADQYLFSTKLGSATFNQTIPFDSTYGAIILPVTVGGKTFNFVFDTGAPTSVSDSAAKYLGLQQVFEGFGVHNPNGEVRKQPIYRIPDLQLGNVHFKEVGCISFNFDALSEAACTRLDGIIGANMMRSCSWKIDFTAGTCTASSTVPSFSPDAISLPFHTDFGGSPQVTTKYGNIIFDAGWDSGNNGLFEIADSIFFKFTKQHRGHLARGTGEIFKTIYGASVSTAYRAAVDSLLIGGRLFNNEVISISPVVHPIIGTAFMRNHGYFVLDWKAGMIHIGQGASNYTTYRQSFGFSAGVESGALKVVFVWEGSPAAKAGLRVGDLITAVNEQPTKKISAQQWCPLRSSLDRAQSVSVEVADAAATGGARRLVLSRTDLLQP